MRSFLTGLGIGLPLGMLFADLAADRGWWSQLQRRGLNLVQDAVESLPGNAGRNLGDVVERQTNPEESRREHRATEIADIAHHDGGHVLLNDVTRDQLLKVYGIGPVTSQKILDGRPYRSDREVVERGIVSEHTFQQLQRELL